MCGKEVSLDLKSPKHQVRGISNPCVDKANDSSLTAMSSTAGKAVEVVYLCVPISVTL